ncbi:MAG: hypothetical protein A3F83_16130 [Candidatus Glassbacteria bacterium RIFCSPLOWO2_12_FULL_58_11]|uniref:HIT domain-containing protein n=1 Tax=Candidatus Glassbacteria bacterium RIFCSPLOWO2_12_FULL_58_11 TaxID=1817867 RepID=A0A1F5YTZ7_9BACT|nr:MAG: hypothetical protein A3F83_16130 [Candidatus Glassbacteria bacterium RIFCSPLOWO2_12_FULL_58_11]
MKIERNLIIPGKLAYVRGKKPDVPCILCAIRDHDPQVTRLELFRDELLLISLNLYPYNPGHLMVFPLRHLTDIREMSEPEVLAMHRLTGRAMAALDEVFQPSGFNIGYNVGATSGASIQHIHCHIVPRHRHEIGLLEMISEGSRVLVEDPRETLEKLHKVFSR